MRLFSDVTLLLGLLFNQVCSNLSLWSLKSQTQLEPNLDQFKMSPVEGYGTTICFEQMSFVMNNIW